MKLFLVSFEITDGEHGYIFHRTVKAITLDEAARAARNYMKTFWCDHPPGTIDECGTVYNMDGSASIELNSVEEASMQRIVRMLDISQL